MGSEYFFAVAESFSLDEIWLIARREGKLAELAANYPDKKIKILPYDLTERSALDSLCKELEKASPDIRLLINNAGFGLLGNVSELPYDKQADMCELNCAALTAVCAMSLKYMKSGSAIINVSSIASFAPNPRMSVYCSTKAYVTSFTKSLRFELKNTGINAIAVCPGPMSTEFLDVAGINGNSKAFDKILPRCNPKNVARISLKKAFAGKAVYTNLLFYKFYRVLAKLLPHNFIMHFSKT